jgi:hypothetical protein
MASLRFEQGCHHGLETQQHHQAAADLATNGESPCTDRRIVVGRSKHNSRHTAVKLYEGKRMTHSAMVPKWRLGQ